MKGKNVKITAGVLVIVAAIAYLIISGMSSATPAYALTVQQALAGQGTADKYYRIEANIDAAHAQWNGDKTPVELKFDLYDPSNPEKKLTVIYNDVKPDNFSEATQAVVQGKFNPDGTFHADQLLLKCPSKYEAENTTSNNDGPVTKFLKSLGLKS